MNIRNKLMMLSLTALLVQSVGLQAGIVEWTKQAWQDIKAYRQCRKTERGCPPELTARLKKLAFGSGAIAAAAVAVLATTTSGLFYKSLNEPTVANAARKFEVDLKNSYNRSLLEAFASNQPDTIARNYDDAMKRTASYDRQAIRAAGWLADRNMNRTAYVLAETLLKKWAEKK